MTTDELLANLPATIAEIAQWNAVPRREVEAAVQEARLAGLPLVSDGNGLRLAQTPAEVTACCDALQRRIASQYLTLRALRRTAQGMAKEADLTLGLVA